MSSVDFVWANDHQNREAVVTWDSIPPIIPRIGERIWLSDAKDVSKWPDNEDRKYSFEMAIVAEVEWMVDPLECHVTIVMRDPTPDEWSRGSYKLYPEYEYANDGSYVIKESTGDMRITKDPEHEQVISAESLGVSELHS